MQSTKVNAEDKYKMVGWNMECGAVGNSELLQRESSEVLLQDAMLGLPELYATIPSTIPSNFSLSRYNLFTKVRTVNNHTCSSPH